MLTLLEEVVLLAVNDKTGELTSAREIWTEYALAAGVLFDLALAKKIDTDTEEVIIVDREPTGVVFLDRMLAVMAEKPELKSVQQWIEELVRRREDLEGAALASLQEHGILRHEKTKKLWIIDVERFPLINVTEQEFVKRRLERAVLTDAIPPTRDIMLVSLADGCGLLEQVMSAGALTLRRERIQTLCGLETISRKVAAAIRGIEEFRHHVMTKVV
jgi:golgi phosphoprotein 3